MLLMWVCICRLQFLRGTSQRLTKRCDMPLQSGDNRNPSFRHSESRETHVETRHNGSDRNVWRWLTRSGNSVWWWNMSRQNFSWHFFCKILLSLSTGKESWKALVNTTFIAVAILRKISYVTFWSPWHLGNLPWASDFSPFPNSRGSYWNTIFLVSNYLFFTLTS